MLMARYAAAEFAGVTAAQPRCRLSVGAALECRDIAKV